jgi:hypothetical protein
MKMKLLLIEPLLIAEVVLCWIVALPVLAVGLSGIAMWDKADLALQRSRVRVFQMKTRSQRRRAGVL